MMIYNLFYSEVNTVARPVKINRKKAKKPFSELEAKKQIRRLKIQNNKLTREVESLKEEIDMLKGKGGKLRAGKYRSAFRKSADKEHMFAKKNYPAFIWSHLMHTSFFNIYRRILNYVRKYAFITTTLKIVSLLFVFVEAILLIIISTSAFIASILFTVLVSHALMLVGLFTRKKQNRKNKILLSQKNAIIFFPPKERAFDAESYFKYLVNDFAKQKNTVVIVVSPYILKSNGLFTPKKPYHSARADGDNILLVRRNYYFALKKIIDSSCSSVTEIY